MSISKFSKDIFIVAPNYEEYHKEEEHYKKKSLEYIDNIVSRLYKLGFREFKMISNDSLTFEVKESINRFEDCKINMYDALPKTDRQVLVPIVDIYNRYQFVNDSIPLPPALTEKETKKLNDLEINISSLLGGKTQPKIEMNDEQKLKIILNVIAHIALKLPITDKILKHKGGEINTVLHFIGKTYGELTEQINSNLSGYWNWAVDVINTQKEKNFNLKEDNEVHEKQIIMNEPSLEDENFLELLSFLSSPLEDDITKVVRSEIEVSINTDELEQLNKMNEEKIKSEEELKTFEGNLREALTATPTERMKVSDDVTESYTQLLKTFDLYKNLIFDFILERSNLIVNFHYNLKDIMSRKLPYDNPDSAKIILNVNLRTGDVEAFFRGGNFRINLFFDKNEEVKTNAEEW